jgi:tetratricopeptide (TPR) repeat protein
MQRFLNGLKLRLGITRLSRPGRALALYEDGVRFSAAANHKRAVECFSEAIKLAPNTGKLLHHRGASFAGMGSFDAAVFDYDTAVRLDPAYPDTYLDRGNVRLLMDEPEKAARDYSEAIRLRPGWAEAYANRAVAHAETGDAAASNADAQRAVSLGVDEERLRELLNGVRESDQLPGDRSSG